jgi:SAM-dependent methyltransferase
MSTGSKGLPWLRRTPLGQKARLDETTPAREPGLPPSAFRRFALTGWPVRTPNAFDRSRPSVEDARVQWDSWRTTYDRVADAYERRFADELDHKPSDRDLLDAFSTSVRGPVLDIGCGPGQIGAYVRGRGHSVIGLDFSEPMARHALSRLTASAAADMHSLPVATSSVGGLVAFYSLIHIPRAEVVGVIAEFARVLRPRARLLLSAHEGTGVIERDEFIDLPVPVVATLFELDELVEAIGGNGFAVVRAERRRPYATESDTVRLYVEAVRR